MTTTKRKQMLPALLLAVLCAAAGCGGEAAETQKNTETAPVQTESVTETAETDAQNRIVQDSLPEADFGGRTFRIAVADQDVEMQLADTLTGSQVNDAVYNANRAVEERFHIRLERVETPYCDPAWLRNSILSGDDAYELGINHDITSGNLAMEGLFLNLYDIPHLDFSMPWWPPFAVEQMTLNHKMFVFSNFIGYNGLRGTKCMYVNLNSLKEYDVESPFVMVRSGTWTLDRVISMTKDIYRDENGDGSANRDDFYGFAFTGLFYGWLENFGIEAYEKEPEGAEVTIALNTPYTEALTSKLKSWLHDGNAGVYYRSSHVSLYDKSCYASMFADGRCMFTYGSIYVLLKNLENSSVNYAFLPMPKYDEAQSDYLGVCYESPMWVPNTVTDTEYVGMILEGMSYEGWKTILPAYKDVALKGRYAQNPDSAEMLDIIFKNRILSFSYMYGGDDNLQQMLNHVVPSKTEEFASYFAKNESRAQKQVEKIVGAFSSAE